MTDLQKVIETKELWGEYAMFSFVCENDEHLSKAVSEISTLDKFIVKVEGLKISVSIKENIASYVSDATWNYFSKPCRDIFDEAQQIIGRELLVAELEVINQRFIKKFAKMAKEYVESRNS